MRGGQSMSVREKLELLAESERRNAENIRKHIDRAA